MKSITLHVRSLVAGCCCMMAAAAVGVVFLALGPLSPPVGAVSPSGKTLSEIEPRIAINGTNTPPGTSACLFKITQPGSYYLTGNLTGVAGKDGIWIDATGVTIDLRGFQLIGGGGDVGIRAVSSNDRCCVVLNGTIRDWTSTGIDLSLNASGGRVEGVHAIHNGGTGISAGGEMAVVNCSAENNDGFGIRTTQHSNLLNCSASLNGSNGFQLGQCVTVTKCSAGFNNGAGFVTDLGSVVSECSSKSNDTYGYDLDDSCSITDCTAVFNTLDGIRCDSACTVRNNTIDRSGYLTGSGAGIRTSGTMNRIEGNNCTRADFGVYVTGTANFISRNTCSTNTQNFVISAGNVHGTIADRTAPGGAAIVGNSGVSTMGTTDPNANIAY